MGAEEERDDLAIQLLQMQGQRNRYKARCDKLEAALAKLVQQFANYDVHYPDDTCRGRDKLRDVWQEAYHLLNEMALLAEVQDEQAHAIPAETEGPPR